jgi:hypothetical protein
MSVAKESRPSTRVPRLVMAPSRWTKARAGETAAVVRVDSPTTCPRLLMPRPKERFPPRVPRSTVELVPL